RIEERGPRADDADVTSAAGNPRSSLLDPRSSVPRCLCLDLPRPVLYERIDARVGRMFAAGLVEEVRALRRLKQPPGREARQALGYKEVFDHLDGRAGLDETVHRIQTRTRHFAKQQL